MLYSDYITEEYYFTYRVKSNAHISYIGTKPFHTYAEAVYAAINTNSGWFTPSGYSGYLKGTSTLDITFVEASYDEYVREIESQGLPSPLVYKPFPKTAAEATKQLFDEFYKNNRTIKMSLSVKIGGKYKLVRHPNQPIGKVIDHDYMYSYATVEWDNKNLIPPRERYPESAFYDGTFQLVEDEPIIKGWVEPKCECGSAYSGFPTIHSHWCPMYRGNK